MSRPVFRPCANCGILMQPERSSTLFCSELCSQVAKAIRYMRARAEDGRDKEPDVQYAIRVRLAQIAAGGYHERKRTLSREQRSEVTSRYKGRCVICGAPGTEVDHIKGSSSEPSNLQLLCTPCHRKKTEFSFRAATSQEIAEVFEPIRKRATAPAPLQPSDMPDWAYRLWACDPLPSDNDAQEVWRDVVKRDFPSVPLYSDLTQACAGFPERLAPWSWYKGPH